MRLYKQTSEIARKQLKGVPLKLTPEQRNERSKRMKRSWKKWKKTGWRPNDEQRPWTRREIELLGTAPDVEVARFLDRSRMAVRHKRRVEGIPACQWRPWTAAEDEIVKTLRPVVAATKLRRSLEAVYGRRKKLGIREAK